MKISIVVPSRNGAPYLRHCLETCLASPDRDLEVVVSDNDSADDTREMVATFSDGRLHYYNTGESLSMRRNFEFALGKATGDYIIFIGDDDGVLKDGLATLRRVLEKYRPDVVNWRHITYKWPHVDYPDSPSVLKFRPQDFFGPLYKRNARKMLDAFFAGARTSYRDAAHIYHGAVSRQLIEKTRARTGDYFMGQSPDIYTGFANLTQMDDFIWIRNPVTIGGESPKSNGAACLKDGKRSSAQAQINKSFIDLAGQDDVVPETDLSLRCLAAHVYANLIRVNETILNGAGEINHRKWRETVLAANDRQEPAVRQRQKDILHAFFAKADPLYVPPPPQPAAEIAPQPDEGAATSAPPAKNKAQRPDLLTVEDARRWIDAVTEEGYLPQKFLPLALPAQALHAFRLRGSMRKNSYQLRKRRKAEQK